MKRTRALWTDAEIWRFLALYPDASNASLARRFQRTLPSITAMSGVIGVHKSAEYLARLNRRLGRRLQKFGRAYRFPPGHVPSTLGLRRPGWAPGRMRETQFQKGHQRNFTFEIGALRLNADGIVDMKIRHAPGATAWRAFHRILWEDAHGPVPPGHIVRFRDGDRFNLDLDNFELISFENNMRRNSIHNLPAPLKTTIHALGVLRRKLNRRTRDEEQDRRSA